MSRVAETAYYEGVISDLFAKWEQLSGTHSVSMAADPITARVALLRRLTKALLKYEAEIPLLRGHNYVDEQYRCYLNLFNCEARLKHALTTGQSLSTPLNVAALSQTVEATFFFDAFSTAIMEWIQMNGVIRLSGVENEREVMLAASSNPSLQASLALKIEVAMIASYGNFSQDSHLDDDTKTLLGFYVQKLRQIAHIYNIELPPHPSEVAQKEVVEQKLLPEVPKMDMTPVDEYYVDEEERKNVEAIAMRLIQRSRDKELLANGAIGECAPAESTGAGVVHWSKFDPTGQPPDTIRTKLVQFYTMFNREKVEDVDDILAHYSGRESVLFAALEAKYCAMTDTQLIADVGGNNSIEAPTTVVGSPNPNTVENGIIYDEAPQVPIPHPAATSAEDGNGPSHAQVAIPTPTPTPAAAPAATTTTTSITTPEDSEQKGAGGGCVVS